MLRMSTSIFKQPWSFVKRTIIARRLVYVHSISSQDSEIALLRVSSTLLGLSHTEAYIVEEESLVLACRCSELCKTKPQSVSSFATAKIVYLYYVPFSDRRLLFARLS